MLQSPPDSKIIMVVVFRMILKNPWERFSQNCPKRILPRRVTYLTGIGLIRLSGRGMRLYEWGKFLIERRHGDDKAFWHCRFLIPCPGGLRHPGQFREPITFPALAGGPTWHDQMNGIKQFGIIPTTSTIKIERRMLWSKLIISILCCQCL